MIEAISSVSLSSAVAQPMTSAAKPMAKTNFLNIMGNGLEKLNTQLNAANQAIQGAASGNRISPHELMITLEQARFELQFAVEVRNRTLEAYQEVIRMQV